MRNINRETEKTGPPLVWAFWHARLLPLVYYYRKRGIVVLVSRSFDGELISRVLHKMGFRTIRGSTTRGAMQSLREVVSELKKGSYIAFTPDGPKGPPEIAKAGAAAAAKLAGAPLIAVATTSNRTWRLKSWDGFRIPKPFAKIEIRHSEPILPGKENAEEILRELQRRLDDVTKTADKSIMGAD